MVVFAIRRRPRRGAPVRSFPRGSRTGWAAGAGGHSAARRPPATIRYQSVSPCSADRRAREGRLEGSCRPGLEVHGRELERGGRLRLARAARERRQVLVERVPHELGVRRDVDDVVALVLRRGHRVVQARRPSARTTRRRTTAAARRPRRSSRTRPRCPWPAGGTRGAGCTPLRSRRSCRHGDAGPRCARTDRARSERRRQPRGARGAPRRRFPASDAS